MNGGRENEGECEKWPVWRRMHGVGSAEELKGLVRAILSSMRLQDSSSDQNIVIRVPISVVELSISNLTWSKVLVKLHAILL